MKILQWFYSKNPGSLRKYVPGFLFLLVSISIQAQINLTNLKGQVSAFETITTKQNVVVFMVSPTCPLCKKYGKTLRELETIYIPKGLRFFYIFPGVDHEPVPMKAFLLNNKLKGEAWIDKKLQLVQHLKADKTPEVFLLNKNSEIKYWGAIDNFAFEVGQTRTVTTRFYLKDAINSLLSDKPVALKHVDAIGCFIE